MIKKNLINEKYNIELDYKYFDYKYPTSINLEYARYKCILRLTQHFKNLLNIQEPIGNILLYGISKNYNTLDPVLIKIDQASIKFIYNIEANNEVINILNSKINKYYNRLDNINTLNSKLKFISK